MTSLRGRDRKVLLLVDHKWRDLPGLAAIKVVLEDEFGVSGVIAPLLGCEPVLLAERPDAVVLNHMNGLRNRALAAAAKRIGSLVVVVPTEGRPQTDDLMRYTIGEFSDVSLVDLWLAWSETVRGLIVSRGLLPPERVLVTGTPRFDFYVPPLRSLLKSQAELERTYGLAPGRPLVSWATNFVLARHVRTHTLDFLVDDFRKLGISNLPLYRDPVALARQDLDVRLQTLEVLGRLCRKFPEVNFILKPHPHEELDDYSAFVERCRAEKIENIAVVTGEYIWDLLNSVSVHIHRTCTTGIEAWLMDVPSVNFHLQSYGAWGLDLSGPGQEALAGDDLVRDEPALADRVAFYLNGGGPDAAQLAVRERYMERWFYRVDGLAAARCAGAIAALLETPRPTPTRRVFAAGVRPAVKLLVNGALGRPLGAPIRSRPRWQNGVTVDHLGQRDKNVTPADASWWASRIREARLPCVTS